jgi:hypothetical protein
MDSNSTISITTAKRNAFTACLCTPVSNRKSVRTSFQSSQTPISHFEQEAAKMDFSNYFKVVQANGRTCYVCIPCSDAESEPGNQPACLFGIGNLMALHVKQTDFMKDLTTNQLNEIVLEGVTLLQARYASGDTAAFSTNQLRVFLGRQSSPPGPPANVRQISPQLLPAADPARSPQRIIGASQTLVDRYPCIYKFSPDYAKFGKQLFGTDSQGHARFVGELSLAKDAFDAAVARNRSVNPDSKAEIIAAHNVLLPLIKRGRLNIRFFVASAFISYAVNSFNEFYGGATDDDKEGLRRLVGEYNKISRSSSAKSPQVTYGYSKRSIKANL